MSRLAHNRLDPLLKPTDFILRAGDQVAITGASGSGKSVFLRSLALLDATDTGHILWAGRPITNDLVPAYRSCIGYVAQRPTLIEGSVLDNLKLPFTLKSLRQRAFDFAAIADLLAQAGKDAAFLDRHASDLSGGESQIVALVRTLQLSPQVMLLDEPTSALDPQSARAVERLVKHWFAEGMGLRACLWVSHDHEQAHRMSSSRLTMEKGLLMPGENP